MELYRWARQGREDEIAMLTVQPERRGYRFSRSHEGLRYDLPTEDSASAAWHPQGLRGEYLGGGWTRGVSRVASPRSRLRKDVEVGAERGAARHVAWYVVGTERVPR
jgi:hypothetical protein